MRFKPTPYEVRCSRCEVSFPVGTRRCIHCGGPTGEPASLFTEATLEARESAADVTGFGTGPGEASAGSGSTGSEPIVASSESPFSRGESGFGDDTPNDRELEMPDEPTSLGRSLIRSLGGIIWVLLLIGFSLARDCGD